MSDTLSPPAPAAAFHGVTHDTSALFQQVAFNHLLGLRREFASQGVARLVLDLQ